MVQSESESVAIESGPVLLAMCLFRQSAERVSVRWRVRWRMYGGECTVENVRCALDGVRKTSRTPRLLQRISPVTSPHVATSPPLLALPSHSTFTVKLQPPERLSVSIALTPSSQRIDCRPSLLCLPPLSSPTGCC